LTCKYWRSESGQLTADSPSSADHSPALTAAYVNLGSGSLALWTKHQPLNQRVHGSSPCAPTIKINSLLRFS
jgi:hypothetical protein